MEKKIRGGVLKKTGIWKHIVFYGIMGAGLLAVLAIAFPETVTTFTAMLATHTLTVYSNGTGGSVLQNGTYATGSHVIIKATPSKGYIFTGWIGKGAGSYTGKSAKVTVTMKSDITEIANFIVTPIYTLTTAINPNGYGSVSINPSKDTYTIGTKVAIKAIGNPGYVFVSWSGAGKGSYTGMKQAYKITMNSNITETANFQPGNYKISVVASPNKGGVVIAQNSINAAGQVTSASAMAPAFAVATPAASGTFGGGSNVIIGANPNDGYNFKGWIGRGSGSYTGPDANRVITVIGDITETARFQSTTTSVTTTSTTTTTVVCEVSYCTSGVTHGAAGAALDCPDSCPNLAQDYSGSIPCTTDWGVWYCTATSPPTVTAVSTSTTTIYDDFSGAAGWSWSGGSAGSPCDFSNVAGTDPTSPNEGNPAPSATLSTSQVTPGAWFTLFKTVSKNPGSALNIQFDHREMYVDSNIGPAMIEVWTCNTDGSGAQRVLYHALSTSGDTNWATLSATSLASSQTNVVVVFAVGQDNSINGANMPGQTYTFIDNIKIH